MRPLRVAPEDRAPAQIISAFVCLLTPVLAKDSKRLLLGCPRDPPTIDSGLQTGIPIPSNQAWGVSWQSGYGSINQQKGRKMVVGTVPVNFPHYPRRFCSRLRGVPFLVCSDFRLR